MLNFVTAAGHGATLRHLVKSLKTPARRWSYEQVIRRASLPRGTWIFTDHERLSGFELSVAGELAEELRRGGCRVLNHPAGVQTRIALLERMADAGINRFRAYRADEKARPTRYPVFLRREYDHLRDGRELIADAAELEATLAALREEGASLVGRLIVEYAGEEAAPGIWYRGSAYRAGDAIVAHHLALDDKWLVKDGYDAARLESYPDRDRFIALERAFVAENQYADVLRQAFDLAGLDYGRADFGFAEGQLQVWEINSNPTHGEQATVFGGAHPGRLPTVRMAEERLHTALGALDTAGEGSVPIGGEMLKAQREFFPLRFRAWRRP
jgi:hypothetical protein